MEDYTEYFTQFEELVNPIVKKEILCKKETQFGLGYRSVNKGSTDFVMKFKIISPWNQIEAIKIVHGYYFRVNDSFIIQQNSKKLADFFAFLVAESLKKVNGDLPAGEIEIPTHQSLFTAIYFALMSRCN